MSPCPHASESKTPQYHTSAIPHVLKSTSLSQHVSESTCISQSPHLPLVHTSATPQVHIFSESTLPWVHTSPGPHVLKSTPSLIPHLPLARIPHPRKDERPRPTFSYNPENRLMLICYYTSVGKASYVFDKCLWKRSLRVPGYVFQIQHTTARKSDLKIVLECTVRAF